MLEQTKIPLSATYIELNNKQQMQLNLIIAKERQLKLIGLTVDDSVSFERVLDYGLTKTLEAINEIGQILNIDWSDSEEKFSNTNNLGALHE